jgi:hypothetical protein
MGTIATLSRYDRRSVFWRVTLSGSYWRREQWIPQAEQGGSAYWYNANGTNSGQPYVGNGPVGGERRWMLYDNNRERGSLVGKFDYRPVGSGLTASLTGFYFTQHEAARLHAYRLQPVICVACAWCGEA